MTRIHIHEDDWGMRCLYPLAAWPEVTADLAAAKAAALANRAPDGFGWSAMYQAKAPSVTFADSGLSVTQATECILPHLPRVREFTATAMAGFSEHDAYGSYEQDAWAFGFDADCYLKLEVRGEAVSEIWFECRTDDAAQRDALFAALLAIDVLVPSVLIDYWLEQAGILRDAAFRLVYLDLLRGEEPD